MRIAVSGSHCSGKSTLIDAFLIEHPNYVHEPEAYDVLQELHGESFAAEPTADDLMRQLEYLVRRLGVYKPDDLVVFERSPVDYLAYMLALEKLQRSGADRRLSNCAADIVSQSIALLDLIAFIPIDGSRIETPEDEDPRLRRSVDKILGEILLEDDLGLFAENRHQVVEVAGSIEQRLQAMRG